MSFAVRIQVYYKELRKPVLEKHEGRITVEIPGGSFTQKMLQARFWPLVYYLISLTSYLFTWILL